MMRKGRPPSRGPPMGVTRSDDGAIELPGLDAGDETGPVLLREGEHGTVDVLRVAHQHGRRNVRDLDAVPGGAASGALTPGESGVLHGCPLPRGNAGPFQLTKAPRRAALPPSE